MERMRAIKQSMLPVQRYRFSLERMLDPDHEPLEPQHYEEMLECHDKYRVYEAAVTAAARALRLARRRRVRVVIVGPGALGGEILNVIAGCSAAGVALSALELILIEKNHLAVTLLRTYLREHVPTEVHVRLLEMDARCAARAVHPSPQLVVSEMLGSAGDNEFAPEILEPLVRAWPRAHFIPRSVTTFAISFRSQLMEERWQRDAQGETCRLIPDLPSDARQLAERTALWTFVWEAEAYRDGALSPHREAYIAGCSPFLLMFFEATLWPGVSLRGGVHGPRVRRMVGDSSTARTEDMDEWWPLVLRVEEGTYPFACGEGVTHIVRHAGAASGEALYRAHCVASACSDNV